MFVFLFLQDGRQRSHHHSVHPPASILHLPSIRQPHSAGQRQTGASPPAYEHTFKVSPSFLLFLFHVFSLILSILPTCHFVLTCFVDQVYHGPAQTALEYFSDIGRNFKSTLIQ